MPQYATLNTLYLNIISFDVPYPPNYGGVIDIIYKLKALHDKGVKIILHCFVYADRKPNDELNNFCEQVFYYKRNEKLSTHVSLNPYIIQSRKDKQLLENLLSNDYPVLFEGLHCCAWLDHPRLKHRKKLLRMHNIEWKYYLDLIPQAKTFKQKAYYLLESYKLRQFENKLRYANWIFSVSDNETDYCAKFAKSSWLPAFHGNTLVEFKLSPPSEKYVIFHGNLDIEDNRIAARLLDEVCGELNVKCIITGKNVNEPFVNRYSSLVTNPQTSEMQQLIQNSQICFVHSAFANGIKLKLLYSLFNGRHVISNKECVAGTKLEELVILANSKAEIKQAISDYLQKDFTEAEYDRRKNLLQQYYDNEKNADLVIQQM